MKNYMKIISFCHPGSRVTCHGNPEVYEDIVWDTAAVAKSTLDDNHLDLVKHAKCVGIDRRTGELIGAGFTFQGETFSMSMLAQTNWIGLSHSAQRDLITYPIGVSTSDDGEFMLTSKTHVQDFFVTGLGTKLAHLNSGRALRLQVKAAVDEAAVDAIVDNR